MGCLPLVMFRLLFPSACCVLAPFFSALPLSGPGGIRAAWYFLGLVYLGVMVFNGVYKKKFQSPHHPFFLRGCLGFFALVVLIGITSSHNDISWG